MTQERFEEKIKQCENLEDFKLILENWVNQKMEERVNEEYEKIVWDTLMHGDGRSFKVEGLDNSLKI